MTRCFIYNGVKTVHRIGIFFHCVTVYLQRSFIGKNSTLQIYTVQAFSQLISREEITDTKRPECTNVCDIMIAAQDHYKQ